MKYQGFKFNKELKLRKKRLFTFFLLMGVVIFLSNERYNTNVYKEFIRGQINEEKKIKREKDNFDTEKVRDSLIQINQAEAYHKFYGIYLPPKKAFEFLYIKKTALKKTLAANKIKSLSYDLEANIKYLLTESLSLGILKNDCEVIIIKDKIEILNKKIKFKEKASSLERLSKFEVEKIRNEIDLKKLKIRKLQTEIEFMRNMIAAVLGLEIYNYTSISDIQIIEEISIDREYYIAKEKNRFEIRRLELENEIHQTDLDFSENYIRRKTEIDNSKIENYKYLIGMNLKKRKIEKLKIEHEINKAFNQINSRKDEIKTIDKLIETLNLNLSKIKKLEEKNYVNEIYRDEINLMIKKHKLNRKLILASILLDKKKLERAISVGPAFDYDYSKER